MKLLNKVSVSIVVGLGLVSIALFQNCGPSGFQAANVTQQSSETSSLVDHQHGGPNIMIGLLRNGSGAPSGQDVEGRIMILRDTEEGTKVYLHATGFTAGASYMSHVHDQACALGGGGHYKIDYGISTAIETNEIWPALTVGADGSVTGSVISPHLARAEASSLVIHDSTNARLACGTFYPQSSTSQKGGKFITLPGGVTAGRTVSGSAVLIRNGWGNQTVLKIAVTGLAPNVAHMAHIHNLPCSMNEGGTHYKINNDVTETTASAANEIWASFTTSATGSGFARTVINGHVARADAASVVIHDPTTPSTRLACVDLNMDAGFQSLQAALNATPIRNITGTGSILRTPDGNTTVRVSITGLAPNTNYMGHVHDRPCHIANGGGHYKIDYGITTALESNEIWPTVMTDANGAGSGTITVHHIARPEAYSIVFHDPSTPTNRLACVDLY